MQVRRWSALGAVVGVCAVAAAGPATAGAGWLPAQTVGSGGEGGPYGGSVPHVAMNRRGDAAVTTGPEDAPLALATRPAGAPAFSPVTLRFTYAGINDFVSLLLGPDGTVLLGLRANEGIRLTTGPLAGPLDRPAGDASVPWPQGTWPRLAIADEGSMVAAWNFYVEDRTVVRWSVKPPGGTWSAVGGSDPEHTGILEGLSVSPDGHALITFTSSDPFGDEVYVVSRAPGGAFGTPELVSGDGDQLTYSSTSAVADGGAAVVAFGSHSQVVAVSRTSGSAPWGARDVVATGATTSRSIVVDEHGDFVLAYVTEPVLMTDPLYTRLVTGSADGTHDAPRDLGVATIPAFAVSGDGTVTAVWRSFAEARLVAMRRPAGGSWSVPQAIDDADDPTQFLGSQWPAAEVAADGDGDAVVGWVAMSGAYRVRLFDTAAPDDGGGHDHGHGGHDHGDDGGGGHDHGGQGDGGQDHGGSGGPGHGDGPPAGGHPGPPSGGPSQPRCVVPALRNHTLAHAKVLLRRAHCALGRTTTPRRLARHRRLVVRRQSRPTRTQAISGTRVDLTLGLRPGTRTR